MNLARGSRPERCVIFPAPRSTDPSVRLEWELDEGGNRLGSGGQPTRRRRGGAWLWWPAETKEEAKSRWSQLYRQFRPQSLSSVVPRWSKSSAVSSWCKPNCGYYSAGSRCASIVNLPSCGTYARVWPRDPGRRIRNLFCMVEDF